MISIIDYGVGNVASVKNMLSRNGTESEITNTADQILQSDKIILPGVGSFDTAMERLSELNLIEVIQQFAGSGKPMLGICLGAQLLMDSSEEGKRPGLHLLKGTCKRFKDVGALKIPHMGWCDVTFRKQTPLTNFIDLEPRFYFVHSYHIICNDPDDILGVAYYGNEFTSAVNNKNVFGVQFHPEKSHRYGMELLNNFAAI